MHFAFSGTRLSPRFLACILIVALGAHTAFGPMANWVVAVAADTSEEESDSRQLPVEEEADDVVGPVPQQGLRVRKLAGWHALPRIAQAERQNQFFSHLRSIAPFNGPGRNGVGVPLRC